MRRSSSQFAPVPYPVPSHAPPPYYPGVQSGRTSRASGDVGSTYGLSPSTAFVHVKSPSPVQYSLDGYGGYGYQDTSSGQYLTTYNTLNHFGSPSSAGTDDGSSTNWPGNYPGSTSDMSTPSLVFDSVPSCSSSESSFSPSLGRSVSDYGRRRSVTSRPPSSLANSPAYHESSRGLSRHQMRRGSLSTATPYDRHAFGEDSVGRGAGHRKHLSASGVKDKEREKERAKAHRDNESQALRALQARLHPIKKRSRVEIITDATSMIDQLQHQNSRYEREQAAWQAGQEYKFVAHGDHRSSRS